MLISESKLRRIIRQELVKEAKQLNENRLLTASLALLMTVSSAVGINSAQAEKIAGQSRTPLAKCIKQLKSSSQSESDIVQKTIELAEKVNEEGDNVAKEVAQQTCELVLSYAGSLTNPGIKLK